MNFAGCIPRFLKAHGSLILTILSGFGLVATVVETAKVAPEAEKDLQEELHWQTHFRVDELMEEAEEDPERVAAIAERHACDVLVLSGERFENGGRTVPVRMGIYRLYRATGKYLVYVAGEEETEGV